jgi:hypothetical protein
MTKNAIILISDNITSKEPTTQDSLKAEAAGSTLYGLFN